MNPYVNAQPGYPPPPPPQRNTVALVGEAVAGALVTIGLALSFASVSVLSGDTVLWVAAGLTAAGSGIAWTVPGVRLWARITAAVLAVLVLLNTFYADHQLSQRRDQIQRQLQQLGQVNEPPSPRPLKLSHQAVEAYIVNTLGEWVLCNNGRDFVMHRAGEYFQCTPTTTGGETSYMVTITNPRTGTYQVS
jgi:hypothetical protein